MKAVAVIPIKRFGAAKTRLSGRLDPAQRATVAEAMLADVLAAVDRSTEVERVLVVSGEPRAVEVASQAGVAVLDDDDSGHSEAAVRGAEWAAGNGARCVVLLPGDCPFLDPEELDAELMRTREDTVAQIADRHGSGTNGLILCPPGAIRPAFGPGSRDRHEKLAREAGVDFRLAAISSMGLDLDTPEDLAELSALLGSEPERAPRTAAALATIGEIAGPTAQGNPR